MVTDSANDLIHPEQCSGEDEGDSMDEGILSASEVFSDHVAQQVLQHSVVKMTTRTHNWW